MDKYHQILSNYYSCAPEVVTVQERNNSQLTTSAQLYKLLLALGRAPAPKKDPSYTPKTQACSKRHLVNNINAVVIQQATQ